MKLVQKAVAVALSATLTVGMMPALALATTAQEAADAEQAFTNESLKTYSVKEVPDGQAFSTGLEESRIQLMTGDGEEAESGDSADGEEPAADKGDSEPKKTKAVEVGKTKKLKGTFTFTLKGTSLQMAILGGSMEQGKQAKLATFKSRAARFYLQRVSKKSKYCYIRNAASGHALTAKNGKVVQMKTTKKSNQRWRVMKMDDGTYTIKSKSTGMRIAVEEAKNHAGLVLQKASNAKTQRFKVKAAKAAYMLTRQKMIDLLNGASGKKALKMVNCTYSIPSKQKKALQHEIKRTKNMCGTFGFVLVDLRTGEGFCYDSDADIHSASTLKGPYLASINKYQPKKARAYRSHYYQLIHFSSNEEYSYLRGAFGSESFKKYMKRADVHDIDYRTEYQHIMVKSLAKLWVCNWEYFNGGTANAKNIRGLYKHINGSEICTVLGYRPGYTTYTKGGWVPDSGPYYTSYNSCGIVIRPDGTRYLLCVMTKLNPYGVEMTQMQRLINAINNAYGSMNKNCY